MKNKINIAGVEVIKAKPSKKQEKKHPICAVSICTAHGSGFEYANRVYSMRQRFIAISNAAQSKGYKFVKTEWVSSLIEKHLPELEKMFGVKS